MPVYVTVVNHNKLPALRIENGYRKGQLIQTGIGTVQNFRSPESAIEWATDTGYTLLTSEHWGKVCPL